jgi:hypothetical protein
MRRLIQVAGLGVALALASFSAAGAYPTYGTCSGECDSGQVFAQNVTMNQCCSGQFRCPDGSYALYYYWIPQGPYDVVYCP